MHTKRFGNAYPTPWSFAYRGAALGRGPRRGVLCAPALHGHGTWWSWWSWWSWLWYMVVMGVGCWAQGANTWMCFSVRDAHSYWSWGSWSWYMVVMVMVFGAAQGVNAEVCKNICKATSVAHRAEMRCPLHACLHDERRIDRKKTSECTKHVLGILKKTSDHHRIQHS